MDDRSLNTGAERVQALLLLSVCLSLIKSYVSQTVIPSGFRVGMKLEAVDKKNPAFICVATVTDMVDNRFLVHFDNWDESYDYW